MGVSLLVIWPEMTTPNRASQKNSYVPNRSAASPSSGAINASARMPTSVPRVEDVVGKAHGETGPALAGEGVPSSVAAAFAGVPGMLRRMAAVAAAVDGTEIDAHQRQDRLVGRHLVGQGDEQRDAHGGGEARHDSDGDAKQARSRRR